MSSHQKLKLGEYTVVIIYDETDKSLSVSVFDEAQGLIESMEITNDNEPEKFGNIIDPTLN